MSSRPNSDDAEDDEDAAEDDVDGAVAVRAGRAGRAGRRGVLVVFAGADAAVEAAGVDAPILDKRNCILAGAPEQARLPRRARDEENEEEEEEEEDDRVTGEVDCGSVHASESERVSGGDGGRERAVEGCWW
jgi:superfamily II DNA/RNA helicase